MLDRYASLNTKKIIDINVLITLYAGLLCKNKTLINYVRSIRHYNNPYTMYKFSSLKFHVHQPLLLNFFFRKSDLHTTWSFSVKRRSI